MMQNRRFRNIRTQQIALLFLIFFILFALPSCVGRQDGAPASRQENTQDAAARQDQPLSPPVAELRGVWIATVGNIDYPSSPDASPREKKSELDRIVSNCAQWGLNAIFFQVRPCADAFYDSDYFPVSRFFQSDGGALDFDPLQYLIRAAAAQQIDVYAWVNPMRVTYGSSSYDALPASHVAKQNPDWVVTYASNAYFDPGLPEVRAYIAQGVAEIAARYDVKGIVFDDYFYPYPVYDEYGQAMTFDDSASFRASKNGMDLDDWRRGNVNTLVKTCYEAVKDADTDCVFGISPFGIWKNNDGTGNGSDTNGLEAYHALYCDATAWARGGYVDFIAPQLYWTCDSEIASFLTLAEWWNRQLADSGVTLYISHGLYQYGNWQTAGEITRQIAAARSKSAFRGSIFYGYGALVRNDFGVADELSQLYAKALFYSADAPENETPSE